MLSIALSLPRVNRLPSFASTSSCTMPSSTCFSPRSVVSSAAPLLTYGVTPSGDIDLSSNLHSSVLEQWCPGNPTTRTILLNRPSALHALSAHMCSSIYNRLRNYSASQKRCVVLAAQGSPGRAFCAGGDVRAVYKLGGDGNFSKGDDLFRIEFRMNSLLGRLEPGIVSVLDGIVMGGGAGLSVHGRFRVATENTTFAMPECAIGLSPDVGASYFLSRLREPGLGMYLALTGARLNGAQMKEVGLATHCVKAENVGELMTKLQRTEVEDDAAIQALLKEFEVESGRDGHMAGMNVIRECFTADSVPAIMSKLEAVTQSDTEEGARFAGSALELMRKGCPTSVKVAFQAQTRGAKLSLDDCLRMEFRIVARCLRRDDFYAGIKSVLITKDRNPVWKPAKLEDVSDESVSNFFAPLENDLQIPELVLDDVQEEKVERPLVNARL